ncbi:MAG: hypothetical protein PVH19_11655 [Planctomycetia bacterium]
MAFILAMFMSPLAHAEETAAMSVDQAFEQLPDYQYGQDLKPLLRIEKAVFASMNDPTGREKIAARLGAILASDKSSLPAKQFACLQLRQVGTEKEVPRLQALLADKKLRQDAYLALYQIPGQASSDVLRDTFARAIDRGEDDDWIVSLLGFVTSRKDAPSRALLMKLVQADSKKAAPSDKVRRAAIRTLGKIADAETEAVLFEMAKARPLPTSSDLADALLDIIQTRCKEGKAESIRPLLAFLAQPRQKVSVRRAGFTQSLANSGDKFFETLTTWLTSGERVRQETALAALARCSKEEAATLLKQIDTFPHSVQTAVVESLARRHDPEIDRKLQSWADGERPERLLLALQLGLLGDTAVRQRIPKILAALSGDEVSVKAAEKTLLALPRNVITPILLEAFGKKQYNRAAIMRLFAKLRLYEAIDPLLVEAAKPDANDYQPALDTLAKIADPDKHDLTRLLKLLVEVPQGKQADAVQRTILIVCNKKTDARDRSALVLPYFPPEKSDKLQVKLLPLLGRLGGEKGLAVIEAAMVSKKRAIKDAGIRAICNWPDASVADRLMTIVKTTNHAKHRRWALRAHVRVITLKSDRPPNETLVMLQKAMRLTTHDADRCLILKRAGTARTMETVRWLAPYLKNQTTAESAAESILNLAHHKFLRNPNKAEFTPLFELIGKVSKDPKKVDRANRYRLGM